MEDLDPPGTWIPHSKYEREVVQALSRVLRRMKWADVTELEHRPDAGCDYLADTNRGRIVVEVKYSRGGEFAEKRADQAAHQLAGFPAELKFLVSNAHFPAQSVRHLASTHVMPITWRSPKDDHLLEMAISTALREAGDEESPDPKSPRGRGLPSRLPSARSAGERASKPGRPRLMAKGDIETYYEDGQWKNRPEGNQRASTVHATKAEAEAAGRQMAKQRDVEHVIKKKGGTIGEKDSYPRGRDPRQTKG
ncbi:DUF2188 domain-containing protein [Micromonospora sp. WMMA2032]|uniref:DUF2188 domain-containing protein n=1 Tax=Micromonospora sp. WMMA2032 TaxID=2039870 RepID=UPI0020A25F7E|nr:DUF2188 domain-containing protein [Micromonospora sp. WMMA2032]